MKEQIFKYITENEGTSLIEIYDKFKRDQEATLMIAFIQELENENKIKLSAIGGYSVWINY